MCVYFKTVKGQQVVVGIYVNDKLTLAPSNEIVTTKLAVLQKVYTLM